MKKIFMLVYSSEAAQRVNPTLLRGIMDDSSANNLRDDISGFLVERHGYFLQLLEGPEEQVRKCYARIVADSRHRNIVLQGEAYSDHRMMPDWGMGYVEPGESGEFPEQILKLFTHGCEGTAQTDPDFLMSMLWIFTKNARVRTISAS